MEVDKDAFEEHRPHLRAVAYRMLGSFSEADDAVQEAWLRYHRTDTSGVANKAGWLTTVVSRICLDVLRTRGNRPEEPLGVHLPDLVVTDPESEAVMADSVGLALLVVLDTLQPAERLASVLHDLFGVPFDEIAGPRPEWLVEMARLIDPSVQESEGDEPSANGALLPGQDAILAGPTFGDWLGRPIATVEDH